MVFFISYNFFFSIIYYLSLFIYLFTFLFIYLFIHFIDTEILFQSDPLKVLEHYEKNLSPRIKELSKLAIDFNRDRQQALNALQKTTGKKRKRESFENNEFFYPFLSNTLKILRETEEEGESEKV